MHINHVATLILPLPNFNHSLSKFHSFLKYIKNRPFSSNQVIKPMAEDRQIPITSGGEEDDEGESSAVQPISDRRSVVGAWLAGGVIGGSLLGMMGFSLLASSGLLVVSMPLFLVFSPILLIAGVVLVSTVASFSLAMVMGVAGTAIFWWLFTEFMDQRMRSLKLGFLQRVGET